MSTPGDTWSRHTAKYLGGGRDGIEVLATVQMAMKRASELGASTPARQLEMLAQEFLSTYGAPKR